MGRISVVKESDTGRNQRFVDNKTHKEMNRKEIVSVICNGQYQDYYVRKVNNVPAPCSKPDGNKNNNCNYSEPCGLMKADWVSLLTEGYSCPKEDYTGQIQVNDKAPA